ncbi:MAG: YdeI/OmpD-associated family protein [Bacteroidota bacterium]
MKTLIFKSAFEALTPGRQRGYIIHFSQPKQSKTRISRIEKNIPKILGGKGWNER